MSIAWIAPAALIGIGLVTLPLAIHLLVRQHGRTLAYPSLRFLRETQLAALRRRTIQDAAILLCRIAIIALAAVALAGPILRTPARTAGYAGRTSRAVVALDSTDDALISPIANGAFADATFRRSAISDSLADAVRWLNRQPASSREIVIAGALRRGLVDEADLAAIPKDIGVRFESAAATTSSDVSWPVLIRRDGALMRVDRMAHFGIDSTSVTEGAAARVPDDLVTIAARAGDMPLAGAALRAALDAGVPWNDFDRRIVIVWDGADTAAIDRSPNARIVRMAVPSPPSTAADAVHQELIALSPRHDDLEPVMIAPAQYASWSRPPGPPAVDAPLADEGDRRWIWAAVLALLGLEAWLRRGRSQSAVPVAETGARVA